MRLLLSLAFAVLAGTGVVSSQLPKCQDLSAPPTKELPDGLQFPDVKSALPFDVTFSKAKSIDNDQKAFDLFSWSSFVALNWPANADGTPMNGKLSENSTAPRIWETYIAASQVFKKDGTKPDPWGGENTFLTQRYRGLQTGQRALFATSKNSLSDVLQASFGTNKFPPIADANGMYAFYEIRLNRIEYNYILDKSLYNQDGQNVFLQQTIPAPPIEFPMGSTNKKEFGSMEVKAMWKQLGSGDDPKKFHTIEAIRIDPVTGTPSEKPLSFGLVGMHIVTRTESAPQWIWSTFEHIDNAPDVGEVMLKSHYNFNDPSKSQPASGFGFEPPTTKPVKNPTTQTQITRVLNNNLISAPWTQNLNATMQKKLSRTVWENYRLVSTQWPTPGGVFVPCHLTNTVAETYIQTAGSCMLCHHAAQTAGTLKDGKTKVSANFSYLLQLAQPIPKNK